MWKFCSTMFLMFVTAQAGQNSIFSEYSIRPSSQVAYYHYPAPPQSQQLHSQPQQLTTSRNYQKLSEIPVPTIQSSHQQPQSVQTYQNQYQYNNVVSQQQQIQPQQQQQQQQQNQLRYQTTQTNPQYQNYYRSSSPAIHQLPVVTKQFNSPALDNAAFTMALTNQGYTVGNVPAASSNAPINAARSVTTQSQSSSSSASSSSAPQLSSSLSSSNSLNVKLPLPFGVTPLNIATLPLQGGTPYSAIPNGVTSYGTTYPQRKRRHVRDY